MGDGVGKNEEDGKGDDVGNDPFTSVYVTKNPASVTDPSDENSAEISLSAEVISLGIESPHKVCKTLPSLSFIVRESNPQLE